MCLNKYVYVKKKIIDSLEEIVSGHGVPLTIKLDNGPQFGSEKFKECCEHNGICHQKVMLKWALANGVIIEACEDSASRRKTLESRIMKMFDWPTESNQFIHTIYTLLTISN
jgi:hypothetical protein